MDRQQACNLVEERISNPALLSHSLAVGAVMGALARHLHEDEQRWELAGLLHDIDYEQTADDPERHGLAAGEMLSEMGLDAESIHAVMAHNEANGTARETVMDRALYAADPITGLITACALVRPSKKLDEVKVSSVKKKFKDKAFARGASRQQIDTCTELGLDRGEFITLSLDAMKQIASELGL